MTFVTAADGVAVATHGRSFVERLEQGQTEVLGLGHLGPLERPDLVASSMAAFFSEAP